MKKYKSWVFCRVMFLLPSWLFGVLLVFTLPYIIFEDEKKLDVFIAMMTITIGFPLILIMLLLVMDFILGLFRKYKYKIVDNMLFFNKKVIDISKILMIEIDYGIMISKTSIHTYKITIKHKFESKKKTEVLNDAPYSMIMYIIRKNKNIIVKKKNRFKEKIIMWVACIIIGTIIGLIAKNSRV